ncbi:MAG: response regulator, partial [Gammaproteobacteria bacterium]|nr:response regulator [Gammaproteobacteria bacterium]
MSSIRLINEENGGRSDKLSHKNDNFEYFENDRHGKYMINETFNVLVVDDDVDVAESILSIIEMQSRRFNVVAVYGYSQAVKLSSEEHFDIAFIDIKLGQESGLDLLSYLKSKDDDIYCVMMTAFREADYSVTAVKSGADDYLHKPIKPDNLFSSLSQAVNRQLIVKEKNRTQQRFRAVFEQTFQWLILTDNNAKLLDANQVALDFHSLNMNSVDGLLLYEAPWWSSNHVLKEKIKRMTQMVQNGGFARDEIQLDSESDGVRAFDISIKPIYDISNNLEFMLVELRDITERKLAELKIIESNKNLELAVLKRTEELEKSKEVAEYASKAKSDFISRMSHELRTPMNAVLGFAQLMQLNEVQLSKESNENLNEILNAGYHLLDLINEILDISAIESGKFELEIEKVNLSSIISDSLRLVAKQAATSSITIENETSKEPVIVLAEHVRLKQVLINLLSNAVKYNRTNGKVIISTAM